MPVITGLRKWRGGEVLTARDYVYERDKIVEAVNENTASIIQIQNQDNSSIYYSTTQPAVLYEKDLWIDTGG